MTKRVTIDYDSPRGWPEWLRNACDPDKWSMPMKLFFGRSYVAAKAATMVDQAAAEMQEATRQDAENIERIIRAGRQRGVKEMEIHSRKTLDLTIREPRAEVDVDIGADGETMITVTYR